MYKGFVSNNVNYKVFQKAKAQKCSGQHKTIADQVSSISRQS
jgi:hypothetical protein